MSDIVKRDSNGRFTQGTSGGPGRKPREIEQEYLATMATIVDAEAWKAIIQKATVDAIAGDAKARSWISGYMLGMPVSRVEEPEQSNKVEELIEQWVQAKAARAQPEETEE